MKSSQWLRAASVLSLLFAAGHTLGAINSWSPIGESDVLQRMRSFHFETMSVTRSYLNLYLGFGFIIGIYLLLQAVLLWQLASYSQHQPARVRPLVASFFIASLALCALTWEFIFPVPVMFSVAITIALGMTLRAAGREAATHAAGT
jgi:hypothetical protein